MILRAFFLLLCLSVVPLGTVMAQSYADPNSRYLADKIERMERDLNLVQQQLYRGGVPPQSAPSSPSGTLMDASGGVRLTALEEQIRSLTGQMEEIQHGQAELNRKYDQLAEQIGMMQTGETPTGNTSPASPTKSAASQPFTPTTPTENSAVASKDPIKAQYDTAFQLLKQSKYPEAQTALNDFVTQHENHALAGSAYYWLGEAYYAQKDYEQSAIQFLRGYKKFPKGEKAPDSLLKLSMALGNLHKNREACASLTRLNDEFPKPSNAIKQRAQEESKKLKCS